jgi:hypothetical protein
VTKKQIHQLAREAGIQGLLTDVVCQLSELETFARLVAAAEREECARVCDNVSINLIGYVPEANPANDCAETIRDRK